MTAWAVSRSWSDELNTFFKIFFQTNEIHTIYHILVQLSLFSRGFPVPSRLCWPQYLRISIMYQPAHVQFPKTLTFCALLCRLFNPIPQGSETVHISKARNWIFHCWSYADCLTHRCYLCQIPESWGVPIKAKKFPTPFVGLNFWSFPRLPGVRNKAFIID